MAYSTLISITVMYFFDACISTEEVIYNSDADMESIVKRLLRLEKEITRISELEKENNELKAIVSNQEKKITDLFTENRQMKRKIGEHDEQLMKIVQYDSSQNNRTFTNDIPTKRFIMDTLKSNANSTLKQTGNNHSIAFAAIADQIFSGTKVDDKIPFGYVQLNEGSAYNGTSGVFVCPKAGVYMFSFHIYSVATPEYGGRDGAVFLNVNGTPILMTGKHATTSTEIYNLHGTTITRLNKNDQVWVGVGINGTVVMFMESNFVGIRLTD